MDGHQLRLIGAAAVLAALFGLFLLSPARPGLALPRAGSSPTPAFRAVAPGLAGDGVAPVRDPHFGVVISGPAYPVFIPWFPTLAAGANRLGAGSMRVNVLWACSAPDQYCVEKKEGEYDWSVTDVIVDQARRAGISLLMNIRGYTCHPVGDWSSIPLTSLYAGRPQDKLAAYEVFLRQMVRRYKDRVHYWQIENEAEYQAFWCGSAREYGDVLRVAYRAIKSEDPSSQVVLSGFAASSLGKPTDAPPREIRDLVDAAATNFDIVDFHIYAFAEEIVPRFEVYRRFLVDRGFTGPIWVTETGGPLPEFACTRGVTSEPGPEVQAGEVWKRFALALAVGAQRVNWFNLSVGPPLGSWDCSGGQASNNFKFMSLIRDNVDRPAFATYRQMTDHLQGVASARMVDRGTGAYVVQVQLQTGSAVYVAWAESPRVVSLPETGAANAYTWDGRVSVADFDKIALSPQPVLIEARR